MTLDERGALSRKRIHLREISGDADAPLETVGQDLRAARLRRGDDLATVSRALKIRRDHLEALEEDRFEALPGRAYAVGFVRSYADYLGLDPLQCVERFKGEIAGRNEVQPTVGPPPDAETSRLPQGWLVIGVVVFIIIVYGAIHLARSADKLLSQPVAAVPAHLAPPPQPTVVTAIPPKPAATPIKAPAAPATSAATQAAATPPGGTTAPATPSAAPAGANQGQTAANGQTPSAPPAPDANAQTAANAPQSAASADAQLPPGHVYGAKNANVRVVLRAHAPTRVLIQGADGTVFLNKMLQPGDSYNVPNRVGLTLTTPNGSAVAVELDGQLMGYAGEGSEMTEALSLDPQAIVDRFNR
ncbi:MAG TPA: helix-turn-helix domain-containing protein [Rhizomicrobium sp.]|nr:helix-turn-helix domain-containing protein [Rhizomicrobium sp.]